MPLPPYARHDRELVEEAVLLEEHHERLLVTLAVVDVLDVVILTRDPAQAHDLVHRADALRAGLDALEAVRARVEAVRIVGEIAEALLVLHVARITDEAVGLRERRRPDELRVGLHREAVADAGAALDCRPSAG